jgi:hypothetical protein
MVRGNKPSSEFLSVGLSHSSGAKRCCAEQVPMKPFPVQNRILFYHCPKTAGTSFLRFAEDAFSPQNFIVVSNRARLTSDAFWRHVERWNIRFIGGDFSPQTPVVSGPFARVAFVRHPLKFMISRFCYSYEKRDADDDFHRFFSARKDKKVFDAHDVSAYFREVGGNGQVRFFANRASGPLTAADLAEAKAQLDSLDVVLNADEILKSIDVFRAIFALQHRIFEHHNASNRDRVRLTRAESERLAAEFMPLDYELYQHGLQLWTKTQHRAAHLTAPEGATIVVAGAKTMNPLKIAFRAARKDAAEWRHWSHTKALTIKNRVKYHLEDLRIPANPTKQLLVK